MSAYLRNMLGRVLRLTGACKNNSTIETLGYSADDLKTAIEAKFQTGMTWENYGEWHIDHIRPLSVLIAGGERDPAVLNALSNLQPLWAFENISKGSKEKPLS